MTPPADKLMDRSEAVSLAKWLLGPDALTITLEGSQILARAVLAMDEELRKASESGKENP